MQIGEIALMGCEIGFASEIFLRKVMETPEMLSISGVNLNRHKVTQQLAEQISHFLKVNISPGIGKIPFAMPFMPGFFRSGPGGGK